MLQYIYLPLLGPLSFVLALFVQRPAHNCSTTHVTFILATYRCACASISRSIDSASGQLHPYCEPKPPEAPFSQTVEVFEF